MATKEMTSEKTIQFGIDRKWWILVAVGLGTFMTALDTSVANVTLPILKTYFHSDVSTVEWVVTVYLLVVSGLLLSFGRLGDLQGHKPVYIFGFFIFIISSAICGLAPSIQVLIGARTVQAIGGAMLYANSPAILSAGFPAKQLGQALGLQATMTYLGLTVGPSLGGFLTDHFSWRAVYYINLPVGLAALILCIRSIPRDSEHLNKEPFDFTGAILFMVGLIALLYGLNQGPSWGWTSLKTIALLGLATILLAVFIRIEKRQTHPMLDLSLFNNRLFSSATASAFLNYICLYSSIFLMPFYLIQGRGFTTSWSGLLLTAQPLVMAIAAPISGAMSDRYGSRVLTTIGMTIMAVGLFLLSRLGAASSPNMVMISLAIFGLGTGIFISPNNNALLSSAPKSRKGIASGILATARNSGMVFGIGLIAAVYNSFALANRTTPSIGVFRGFSAGMTVAMVAALLGLLTSATRGDRSQNNSPDLVSEE